MEYSWIIAFWVTIAFYAGQFFLSIKEGTFALWQLERRRADLNFHGRYRWQHLPMSFLNNWTVSVSDLYVFPLINALVVPYLWPTDGWPGKLSAFIVIGTLVSAGIMVSGVFHQAWWGHDENLGHVFAKWRAISREFFMADMTRAGWVHFFFMAAQIAVMLAYIITPMPRVVLFWVSLLLSGFVILQQLQAHYIQKGNPMRSLFNMMWQIVFIWAVAAFKL